MQAIDAAIETRQITPMRARSGLSRSLSWVLLVPFLLLALLPGGVIDSHALMRPTVPEASKKVPHDG